MIFFPEKLLTGHQKSAHCTAVLDSNSAYFLASKTAQKIPQNSPLCSRTFMDQMEQKRDTKTPTNEQGKRRQWAEFLLTAVSNQA